MSGGVCWGFMSVGFCPGGFVLEPSVTESRIHKNL